MLAYAIHSLQRTAGDVAPGSVFETTESEFKEFAALGAVRAATEAEVGDYGADVSPTKGRSRGRLSAPVVDPEPAVDDTQASLID